MYTINRECVGCNDDCHIECDCITDSNRERKIIENLYENLDSLMYAKEIANKKDNDYMAILNDFIDRTRNLLKDINTPYSKIKADKMQYIK
jgi:hypothetical protein